jgi:heme A synthase
MVSLAAVRSTARALGDETSARLTARTWFFRLALAATVATYLLIVAGATVRVTGSGLGCPDWPTCHGRLIPPLETSAIIEYTHRFIGAIASPLILAVPFGALLLRRERRVVIPALVVPALLALQIALGAVVVYLELPPMVVLVHLGFAMLILGGLVWVTASAAGPTMDVVSEQLRTKPDDSRSHSVLLGVTAATLFLLILTGAYTRASGASWACTGFPGCDVPETALAAAEASGVSGATLVGIHLVHRTVAYVASALTLLSVAVVWRRRTSSVTLRRAAALLAFTIVIQVAIGASAVSTGLPTLLRGAHVAGAAAVWAAAVLLFALEVRRSSAGGLARTHRTALHGVTK